MIQDDDFWIPLRSRISIVWKGTRMIKPSKEVQRPCQQLSNKKPRWTIITWRRETPLTSSGLQKRTLALQMLAQILCYLALMVVKIYQQCPNANRSRKALVIFPRDTFYMRIVGINNWATQTTSDLRKDEGDERTMLNKRKPSLLVHNLYSNVRQAPPYSQLEQVRKSQNAGRLRPPMNINTQQANMIPNAYEEVKLRQSAQTQQTTPTNRLEGRPPVSGVPPSFNNPARKPVAYTQYQQASIMNSAAKRDKPPTFTPAKGTSFLHQSAMHGRNLQKPSNQGSFVGGFSAQRSVIPGGSFAPGKSLIGSASGMSIGGGRPPKRMAPKTSFEMLQKRSAAEFEKNFHNQRQNNAFVAQCMMMPGSQTFLQTGGM